MRRRLNTAVIVAVITLAVFCVRLLAANYESPSEAIKNANAAFAAAYKKGDAKAVSEMYTKQAQLFPPDSEVVGGRPAIQKFWQGAMTKIAEIELRTTEVESFGNSLVESGKATLTMTDGSKGNGKYFVMWKKDGGNWKLHRDCWNSSPPSQKK